MIKIKNVTKSYNGHYNAVEDLDLEIKHGEIFGLLGPNGAGKTTTIKMITGIIKPTIGNIEINDISILYYPIDAKEQFGYVPDNPDIFLRLTGLEYLNFMGDVYKVKREDRIEIIEDLAERFEMVDVLGDKIQTYSHGMRQKIVIMGVLIHRPRIWILDEPMTGLDPRSAFVLKEMMKEHVEQGNTVLLSTHILEVAEKICDRVGIINNGKLVYVGTLDKLKMESNKNDSLENIFLELTENE